MIKIYKERKNICGNIFWENDFPEEKRQIIYSVLKEQGFKFVSRFPEGDGITFSFREYAKGITRCEEHKFYHLFYALFSILGEDFKTDYTPITYSEIISN